MTGLIAQHPHLGGVAWDYGQYVRGLMDAGHDVYYFEDSGEWPYISEGDSATTDWIARNPENNLRHLEDTLGRFGLSDRWAYRFPIGPRWYGLSHARRRDVLATADLVLNVSGTLHRPSDYARARLVYIDSDPVFTQVKLNMPRGQLLFRKRIAQHDRFFSFGESLSEAVPPTGHRWRPTRQPIILAEWRPERIARKVCTTVMSWTSYRPLRHRKRVYGMKDVEFRRFVDLPERVEGLQLEVAMGGTHHQNWQAGDDEVSWSPESASATPDETVVERLSSAGWRIVDAAEVCGSVEDYRDYIEGSMAEWSVAKNGYVQGQPGWFSCRSACYLAAGRPVIVQDTGFSSVLPVGEGILPFRTMDEAAGALIEVQSNYARHAAAAREIAVEYFDATKVLPKLIEEAYSDA